MPGFVRTCHTRSGVCKPLGYSRVLCHGEIARPRALTEEALGVVSETGFA